MFSLHCQHSISRTFTRHVLFPKSYSDTSLKRDKNRYVRDLAEDVEGFLNANIIRPVFRGLKKVRFKSMSQMSIIGTADAQVVSDTERHRAHWAEYFE